MASEGKGRAVGHRVSGSAFVAYALTAALLLFGAGSAMAEVVDRIVANVNGEIILLSDVRSQIAVLKTLVAKGAAAPSIGEKEALNMMIDEKIIVHYAKENNISIKEGEVDQTIEQIKADNRITGEFLEAELKRQGMTMPQYREKLKNQMVIQRVMSVEITAANISDDDVKSYYRRRQNDFLEPGRVKIAHIVVLAPQDASPERDKEADAKINRILKEIKSGMEFAEAAKKFSQDGSAQNGGDLGWFARGKMLPEFETTAFSINKGEVAGPIRSQFGYHVIKVTDREEPKPRPVEQVADSIREKLQAEAFNKKRNTWLERLRSQAYIEYMY